MPHDQNKWLKSQSKFPANCKGMWLIGLLTKRTQICLQIFVEEILEMCDSTCLYILFMLNMNITESISNLIPSIWVINSHSCFHLDPPEKTGLRTKHYGGVPIVAHWVKQTWCCLCEDAGSIPGLPQWVKDRVFLLSQDATYITDVAQIWRCYGCSIGLQLQLWFDP